MSVKPRCLIPTPLFFLFIFALLVCPHHARAEGRSGPLRDAAVKAQSAGNYKDAYEQFEALALDAVNNGSAVANDLASAVSCLQSLSRVDEIDALIEKSIDKHPKNWRLLSRAASLYLASGSHGYIVAGVFHRGYPRGGEARYVESGARDRIRALQLLRQGSSAVEPSDPPADVAQLYVELAQALRYGNASWELQHLSDLEKLPDYGDLNRRYWRYNDTTAPVDGAGEPVLYKVPETFESALNDGERWRWALQRAAELDPRRAGEMMYQFAQFLEQQFGVQTLNQGNWFAPPTGEDDKRKNNGIFALHTLAENETVARLASGVRRFRLPDEYSYIKVYRQILEGDLTSNDSYRGIAADALATSFENRRQYDAAAEIWQKAITQFGKNQQRENRLAQILGAWGRFDPSAAQPAGRNAGFEYVFRNGTSVSFEAHEVLVEQLLEDVKSYLKRNPSQLNYNETNLGQIGTRLLDSGGTKYIGKRVASWNEKLTPLENHFDRRVTLHTPLSRPGAYLLTATIAGGNTNKTVLWINDTVIAKKPLSGKAYYYVADAVSGAPIPDASLSLFGFKTEHLDPMFHFGRSYNIVTTELAATTDAQGQFIAGKTNDNEGYQWLVIAKTKEGRFSYLGFSYGWYGNYYDQEYNATKVYAITDRPAYRPEQIVKFKVWVRHAQYDQERSNDYARQSFNLEITDPKQEKVLTKSFTTDGYGGFDGEYLLPKDAALGEYLVSISNLGLGGTFRVEEYKKPEFEVSVNTPTEPVSLGEQVKAKITAQYYFGEKVTKGTVKYKILRSEFDANWFPITPWDWFYGAGFWWFAYDYAWYPGWREWGCRRPIAWWWSGVKSPPEVVQQNEVALGADGTVEIVIDTAIAKELHGDSDHRYEITAEVTDDSRRTIVGSGKITVARHPFKVYAWVDQGYYRAGDPVRASFSAQTLDNKPIQGKGKLSLIAIEYSERSEPHEKVLESWDLNTDAQGQASIQLKAAQAGQYRLSYTVNDDRGHAIEGGYLFNVSGENVKGEQFRFNEIELIPDQRTYSPGAKVRLLINTNHPNSTVLLFVRPANGVYLQPEIISMNGKSIIREIEISRKDMPNFFVEALTISDGKIFSETKEIIVPPQERVLNVAVLPSAERYKPGQEATVKFKVTDLAGAPFHGSTVVSVYDKAVEYISGGSNVIEIREFFWKWRRSHHPALESSIIPFSPNLVLPNTTFMSRLGVFGSVLASTEGATEALEDAQGTRRSRNQGSAGDGFMDNVSALQSSVSAPLEGVSGEFKKAKSDSVGAVSENDKEIAARGGSSDSATAAPTIRKEFADTAYWLANLETDPNGIAEINFKMPDNLTDWKIRAWVMGAGTKVGEGTANVVTSKNLLLRLQAPRFFVEKDEVVLSANIHNFLKTKKSVTAKLQLEGATLEPIDGAPKIVQIEPGGEARVDWRVKAAREGSAVVRMLALADEESDAMEMKFPVYVHGMLKTDSFSGALRPSETSGSISFEVPAERRPEQSQLELRYSPSLAGAMVDALPYLVQYPYGCTEQTLSRFVPTVITLKLLKEMNLNLQEIKEKRTNLNAQEIGDDKARAKQWKRYDDNPVFEEAEVTRMVSSGLGRLSSMQLSDGGWGWFSGLHEYSSPHTTAYVMHGLQTAVQAGVRVDPEVFARGLAWMQHYQAAELQKLKNAPSKIEPYKEYADDLDAFTYMVLTDADQPNAAMRDLLFRDRKRIAVYSMAAFGLALAKEGQVEKLRMILENIHQYLVEDDENQTAYLRLGNEGYWWLWYGSEYEAHAYYLKLLSRTDPKGSLAPKLVKYLLNNRKNGTYWNSTRDTAITVEAFADYLKASGEDRPEMTVDLVLDGQKLKTVQISSANLFTYENKLIVSDAQLSSGRHTIELRKRGTGPLYYNAYLTNFTLEYFIKKAGLEVRVNRRYFRLTQKKETDLVRGGHGQALEKEVEKYERTEIANSEELKSGELVEVELTIDSKNDYEYLVIEDNKPAGFEPVEVRSGYNGNEMNAYVEFRDERVAFFVRTLPRGKRSVSYRLRAEIPGRFSALPTKSYAMYAPELKANSDEMKIGVRD